MASIRPGHYKVYAYVCGAGCIKYPDVDGTIAFEAVMLKRPNGCRYAVCGLWSPVAHAEDILVFDLYRVQSVGRTRRFSVPEPVARHDDVDAAIMATLMLYQDEL